MPTDRLALKDLMDMNKRTLAELVMAQGNQVAQLNKELAVEQWQSGLLAAQRDHLIRWCEEREEAGTVRIWDVYSILLHPEDL